jgi:hypothetical protein
MRLSIKIIVGAAVVAASVAVATFSASAPASASEALRAPPANAAAEFSARKKYARHHSARHHNGTTLRVSKLSKRASDPPNPNRPYYRPVPHFYPFGQDRGFF